MLLSDPRRRKRRGGRRNFKPVEFASVVLETTSVSILRLLLLVSGRGSTLLFCSSALLDHIQDGFLVEFLEVADSCVGNFEAVDGFSGRLIFLCGEVDLPPMSEKITVPRESPMFCT